VLYIALHFLVFSCCALFPRITTSDRQERNGECGYIKHTLPVRALRRKSAAQRVVHAALGRDKSVGRVVSAPLFQLRIACCTHRVEARPRRANAQSASPCSCLSSPESGHGRHKSCIAIDAAEWMSSGASKQGNISSIDRIGETEMDDRRDTSTRTV